MQRDVDRQAVLEQLMRPQPGATVLPIAVFRKLSPEGRRALAEAIDRARRSSGVTPRVTRTTRPGRDSIP